jgi:hypothetical protein
MICVSDGEAHHGFGRRKPNMKISVTQQNSGYRRHINFGKRPKLSGRMEQAGEEYVYKRKSFQNNQFIRRFKGEQNGGRQHKKDGRRGSFPANGGMRRFMNFSHGLQNRFCE